MVIPRRIAVLTAVPAVAFAGLVAAGPAGAATKLRASLTGAAEVPDAGDPNGRGKARITLYPRLRRVCFSIKLRRVGTVMAGHIHEGDRSEAGPVVVALFDKPTKRPRGCVRGVKRSLIREIARDPGDYYVNVHNARFPAGAVRGQLRK